MCLRPPRASELMGSDGRAPCVHSDTLIMRNGPELGGIWVIPRFTPTRVWGFRDLGVRNPRASESIATDSAHICDSIATLTIQIGPELGGIWLIPRFCCSWRWGFRDFCVWNVRASEAVATVRVLICDSIAALMRPIGQELGGI